MLDCGSIDLAIDTLNDLLDPVPPHGQRGHLGGATAGRHHHATGSWDWTAGSDGWLSSHTPPNHLPFRLRLTMQVLPGLLPLLLSKQILKEENYSRLLRPDDGAECAPPPHAPA